MAEQNEQVLSDREAAIKRGKEIRAAARQNTIPPPPGSPRGGRTRAASESPAGDIVRALPGAALLKKAKKLLSGSE